MGSLPPSRVRVTGIQGKLKRSLSHPTAAEIENLKKEAVAFRVVRQGMGEEGGPRRVFDKVRWSIHSCLFMTDLSRHTPGIQSRH